MASGRGRLGRRSSKASGVLLPCNSLIFTRYLGNSTQVLAGVHDRNLCTLDLTLGTNQNVRGTSLIFANTLSHRRSRRIYITIRAQTAATNHASARY